MCDLPVCFYSKYKCMFFTLVSDVYELLKHVMYLFKSSPNINLFELFLPVFSNI